MNGWRSKLTVLWVFATVNYLYCDVVSLMDRNLLSGYLAGRVAGLEINQTFLLASSVLVEIPMAMIVVSRLFGPPTARWANVGAGVVMTAVQLATLTFGRPTAYYIFFSVIEITTTAAIVWIAWRWRGEPAEAEGRSAPAELSEGRATQA